MKRTILVKRSQQTKMLSYPSDLGSPHYEIGSDDLPGSFRHSIRLQGCLDHGSVLDPATDVTCVDVILHKLAHSRPPVVSGDELYRLVFSGVLSCAERTDMLSLDYAP